MGGGSKWKKEVNGVSQEVLKALSQGEPGPGHRRDVCHLFRVQVARGETNSAKES